MEGAVTLPLGSSEESCPGDGDHVSRQTVSCFSHLSFLNKGLSVIDQYAIHVTYEHLKHTWIGLKFVWNKFLKILTVPAETELACPTIRIALKCSFNKLCMCLFVCSSRLWPKLKVCCTRLLLHWLLQKRHFALNTGSMTHTLHVPPIYSQINIFLCEST